jgi:predicted nucleotidyltransferase
VSAVEIPRLEKIENITDEVLEEVVRRVVEAVGPDRIILFGSYAHGYPHPDSDLDLLVIMPSHQPRWQRAIPIYDALRGLLIPKDVVVYTPQEVEEWSEVPQAFVTTAIRTGKVLYEKN